MGTRSKRKATKKTPRSSARAPATGPVTLVEARALASAKRPKRAKQAVRAEAIEPSPATVAAERRKVRQRREQELAEHVRDYTATMVIMKQRGATPPPKSVAAGKKRAVAKVGRSFAPLQIVAEGDSWFHYPAHVFKGGVIPRLEKRIGVPILNLARAGDEVRYMLGVKEREILVKHLRNGCPAGGPWDVLLFSGGGNDIVDNPMALWVKDWDPALPPAKHIHQPRFSSALDLVRAGYEDLIELRNKLSPTTHVILHGYDFAIPDGRGVCFLGPWLKPTFDLRGFPTQAAAFDVVKAMLQQFAALLKGFSSAPKVTFINGQGTLAPQKSSWHNELHPAAAGFEQFADLFHAKLKALFPGRVA